MNKKTNKRLALAVLAAATAHAGLDYAGSVYSDNFERANLNGGSFAYGVTSTYYASYTGNNDTASIIANTTSNWLQVNGSGNSTNGNYASAATSVSTPVSAFSSGYNSILTNNANKVLTWSFNIQESRTAPSGTGSVLYGAAFVLGATSIDFAAPGVSGYAVVMGNGGTPDPLRLISFTNGLVNWAGNPSSAAAAANSILSSTTPSQNGTSGNPSPQTDNLSVKVSYDTVLKQWSLSTRDDEASSGATVPFDNPNATNSSSYTTIGPVGDSSVNTTTALPYLGAFWNHATSKTDQARFDNFNLDVSVSPNQVRNLVWNGTSGNWETAGNWLDPGNGNAAATFDSGASPDNAVFNNGSLPTTVTLGTSLAAGTVLFDTTAPVHTVTGGALTINQGLTANQSVNLNTPVTLGGSQIWTIAGGKNVNVMQAMTGSQLLTKAGNGSLILGGSDTPPSGTFTGGITINAGTVSVTANDSQGNTGLGTGTTTVNNGGTLELTNNVSVGTYTGSPSSATGTGAIVVLASGGALVAKGNVTYVKSGGPDVINGTPTQQNSVLIATEDANTVFDIGAAPRQVTVNTPDTYATIHISGPGRVVLQSGGLSATTTFGGNWAVDQGILQVGPIVPGQGTGGGGEPLNALGFKDNVSGATGVVTLPNAVTVSNGAILAPGTNTPTGSDMTEPHSLRSPITLSGGVLAATVDVNNPNPYDASGVNGGQFSGNLTIQSGTISLTDPVDTTPASDPKSLHDVRNILLVTAGSIPGSITWAASSTLNVVGSTIDTNGDGSGNKGIFTIQRDNSQGGSVTVGAGAQMNVDSNATVQVFGSLDDFYDGTTGVNIANSGTFIVNNSSTKNIGNMTGSGTTSISGSSSLTANRYNIPSGTLTTDSGSKAIVRLQTSADSAAGLSIIGNLALNGGTMDLTNNAMIVTNSLAPIGTYLKNAYNGGAWTGTGSDGQLTSSSAQAAFGSSHPTALGYGTASELGTNSFIGQSVSGSTVLVRYTYSGDANLDGTVNALDLNAVATNWGKPADWAGGAFDYGSTVGMSDFNALAMNFGLTGPAAGPLPLGALVPEPTSITVLASIAGLAAVRRRRR